MYSQDHKVPRKHQVSLEERDHEQQRSQRRQSAHDLRKDPFSVGAIAQVSRVGKVDAVQATDGEREHELEEANDGVDQEADETWVVARGGFLPSHLDRWVNV